MRISTQDLVRAVDAKVGARYSRLSDFTSFPDRFLFKSDLDEVSRVNFELLRLEVLSAIIFNEQIVVPQTVYFSGVLGAVAAEIERAVEHVPPDRVPRVLRQPFVPAMSMQYADDRRGPMGFLLDRIEENPAKGMFGELDVGPGDHMRVREVAKRICEHQFPGVATARSRRKLETEVHHVLGSRGRDLIGLAESFGRGPIRVQADPTRRFGQRLDAALSNKKVRDAVFASTPAEDHRRIEVMIDTMRRDENLTGRGRLRAGEAYAPFHDLTLGKLEQVLNFVFHHEVAERVAAGYTNIEALPGEALVDKIVKARQGKLDSYANFSYNNKNFSAVSAEACSGRQDYVWESVWRGLAQYVCHYSWMESALRLRPDAAATKTSFVAASREILDGLSKSIDKDLVRFDVVERSGFDKMVDKIEKAAPCITLFKESARPAVDAAAAAHVFAITLGVVKTIIPHAAVVAGLMRPVTELYKGGRRKAREDGNLIRKVSYAKRLSQQA